MTTPPNKDFYQWSEVHEITRGPTKLAEVALLPGRFQISGPPELVIMMRTTIDVLQGQDPEEIKVAIYELWSHWHVICSVTGKEVLLCDLRYWDTDGLIYSSPTLIGSTKPDATPAGACGGR